VSVAIHHAGARRGRGQPADRDVSVLTGQTFFPRLIAASFHQGLVSVFTAAAAMALVAALISSLRGGQFYYDDQQGASGGRRRGVVEAADAVGRPVASTNRQTASRGHRGERRYRGADGHVGA
jgi:hypothetical protein